MSCRAFFRRSVQNKAYLKFVCKNNPGPLQFCIIDSQSWKSCKYCRFKKCLKSGMKPCFVLNEDERKIRHEKRTTKCSNNKKISNEEQTSSSNMGICRSPEDIFTMDDMLFILGTIHILRKHILGLCSTYSPTM